MVVGRPGKQKKKKEEKRRGMMSTYEEEFDRERETHREHKTCYIP
jgi:hypothetical protein